jgi:hypothetical protein
MLLLVEAYTMDFQKTLFFLSLREYSLSKSVGFDHNHQSLILSISRSEGHFVESIGKFWVAQDLFRPWMRLNIHSWFHCGVYSGCSTYMITPHFDLIIIYFSPSFPHLFSMVHAYLDLYNYVSLGNLWREFHPEMGLT